MNFEFFVLIYKRLDYISCVPVNNWPIVDYAMSRWHILCIIRNVYSDCTIWNIDDCLDGLVSVS